MSYKHPDGHVFYRRMDHARPMISHGEGIYLYDTDGKRYIDASGGPVVVNVGHGNSKIVEAMAKQAQSSAYVHASMFTSQAIEEYSAALANIIPLDNPRFFFMSSGSEAVETAIKFARQLQVDRGESQRYQIISRWQGYHGLTLGALAISGRPALRRLYQPMMMQSPHIEPPYCYRCPFKSTYPDCGMRCAHALEDAIKINGLETVAAFIAEPIIGATLAGAVPPPEYWPLIREICTHYGVLLIVDEVLTGLGRTGHWFAIQGWDVEPDIITLAKGAGGGYLPLSITAVKTEDVQTIQAGHGDFSHGGTFSHHAVGAATGLAVLQYLQDQNLVEAVRVQGQKLEQKLRVALSDHPNVGDIRGQGLLWGVEFVADRATKEPFPVEYGLTKKIGDTAFEQGLIVYPVGGNVDGQRGDQIIIAPPFTVSDKQLDEIVDLLTQVVIAAIPSRG